MFSKTIREKGQGFCSIHRPYTQPSQRRFTMPASRGHASSNNSSLFALIFFITFSLLLLAFGIYQFMQNEQLRNSEQSATKKLNDFVSTSQYQNLRSLKGSGRNNTVMKQVTADMQQMAQLIGGAKEIGGDVIRLRMSADEQVLDLNDQLIEQLGQAIEAELGDPIASDGNFIGLVATCELLLAGLNQAKAALEEHAFKAGSNALDLGNQIAQQNKEINALTEMVAFHAKESVARENKYTKNEDAFKERFNRNTIDLERTLDDITKILDENKNTIEQYNKNMNVYIEKNNILKSELAKYRPTPDIELVSLKPDGFIVSINDAESIAYINLTNKDHIYRGLTFTIYDSYQEIPKHGKGKGSIEVIEMMDTISKCRITEVDLANPIMEKDIIANLVWDLDRKYTFCVAGNFSVTNDTPASMAGRDIIVNLIEGWGGEVTNNVSISTDFLVLGSEPSLPERKPSDTDMDEQQTPESIAYRNAENNNADYYDIRQEGKALGIPTFVRERFLYFIGYYQQANNPL